MVTERAYCSACTVKNNYFIYVFGGLKDFTMLGSIEQYDIMLEKWLELSISMPSKIIKFGSIAINSTEIIIVGGIFGDSKNDQFSYVNSAYKLDLYTNKWTILPKMSSRRVLSPNLPFTAASQQLDEAIDPKIYAIGGAFDGSCESFNLNTGKWNTIMGYENLLKDNDLQSFSIALV